MKTVVNPEFILIISAKTEDNTEKNPFIPQRQGKCSCLECLVPKGKNIPIKKDIGEIKSRVIKTLNIKCKFIVFFKTGEIKKRRENSV